MVQIEAGEAPAVDSLQQRRKKTTETIAKSVEAGEKVSSQADGVGLLAPVDAAPGVSLAKPKQTRRVGEPKPKRHAVGE